MKLILIKLSSTRQLRPKLGLVSNPDLLGKKFILTGNATTYFSALGIDASDAKILED